ncbi:MAG: YbhB/YbcL family Raf kinase inhibitor-like protein [Pseudomonadota bacterium]
MEVNIDGWDHGEPIPSKFAFGQIPAEGRFELGGNVNPHIAWTGAPAGTKSFALICHDPDVPSSGEDVNQEGKTVPASLSRVDFFHWVLVNIPADLTEIAEGVASSGVTAQGKPVGTKSYGTAGKNDYTSWFDGDPDMGGIYGDYDGPCPPWNDSITHHYHFTVFALDTDHIDVPEGFGGVEARAAIEGHVLAQAEYVGTYTMNRDMA